MSILVFLFLHRTQYQPTVNYKEAGNFKI